MMKYYIDPDQGVADAFSVLYPKASQEDFCNFLSNQDCSKLDPRLRLYSLARLCESALKSLTSTPGRAADALTVASVAMALAHYQTAIRAFTAVIGHPRLAELARRSPIQALAGSMRDTDDFGEEVI